MTHEPTISDEWLDEQLERWWDQQGDDDWPDPEADLPDPERALYGDLPHAERPSDPCWCDGRGDCQGHAG